MFLWDTHLNLFGIFSSLTLFLSKCLTITGVSVSYHELHHSLKEKPFPYCLGIDAFFAAVKGKLKNAYLSMNVAEVF